MPNGYYPPYQSSDESSQPWSTPQSNPLPQGVPVSPVYPPMEYPSEPAYGTIPQYPTYPYEQPMSYPSQGMIPYQPMYVVGAPSAKSKIAAGLLGIFLGALGIHNFYLGRTNKGLAQLLMSVLSLGLLAAVSGLWGFIEGILILVSRPGTEWHHDATGRELQD